MGIMTLILLFQVYLVQDRQHRGAPVGHMCLRWASCRADTVSFCITGLSTFCDTGYSDAL